MSTMVKTLVLKREGKKPLLIDFRLNSELSQQPLIIFCHGYKGFKDWGAWNLMASALAQKGYCVIKFNFSHNGGTMEDPIDFPDLEAFGNNTYSKELDDLNDVINWASTHFTDTPQVNTGHISLLGHSRGGGMVLLQAARDPRITKVITLAGVSDYKSRFPKGEALKNWQEKGVYYVVNGRTKQEMPHYYQYYTNFLENEEALNIEKATREMQIPLLIIHGDADTSVPLKEAKALHRWNANSQLHIIKGADHVFNTKHPWEGEGLPNEMLDLLKETTHFIKQHQI